LSFGGLLKNVLSDGVGPLNLNSLIAATGLFIKYFASAQANVVVVNMSSGAAVARLQRHIIYKRLMSGY